jgi:hypothetical protein
MLQSIGNAHTKRAYALISALEAHEITLDEFSEALLPLPAEVLQLNGTVIALAGVNEPAQPQMTQARLLCTQFAAIARPLS